MSVEGDLARLASRIEDLKESVDKLQEGQQQVWDALNAVSLDVHVIKEQQTESLKPIFSITTSLLIGGIVLALLFARPEIGLAIVDRIWALE